ncbi:hypothetical protein DRE_06604 [Drechslerella stenobrocha 248]|uniref:Uncharacterized protein n=1 Tax=Drechslerella stenobrocha 248 TaxID=1043628 RepID=W7I6U9_9PEZI|nr:hypothetical protein DRE_06604 [Drechslerella stenobrocha 248]
MHYTAEQAASELEARLDNLDSQLEALIQAGNIPPELLDMDNETLMRTLEMATRDGQQQQAKEGVKEDEEKEDEEEDGSETQGSTAGKDHFTNGTSGRGGK